MTELFSLGKIYPSDFLKPNEQPRCEPIELKLVMDEVIGARGFVRLFESAPKEAMWGERYWYRSSISSTMKRQLKDIVGEVIELYELKDGMCWLDIAGNDGYLLSQVPPNIIRVNIDPCDDTFKKESEKRCDLVIQDYFSAEVYENSKYGDIKPSVVSVISMFYDLEDPNKFLQDVHKIMDEDGLLIIQISYSALMLQQLEFSNICHEHKFYYSFKNLSTLLVSNDFYVVDVQLNETNAGSIRIHAMKFASDETKFGSTLRRDVGNFRREALRSHEETIGLDKVFTWKKFYESINLLREITLDFIKTEKQKGKKIYGYGASTKFNTVLQYFNLNPYLITAIADRSPAKHGLRCVGSNIPIISEEQMRAEMPDYLFVGPAHFISEFKEREHEFLERGGKFICIMPSFQIIEK